MRFFISNNRSWYPMSLGFKALCIYCVRYTNVMKLKSNMPKTFFPGKHNYYSSHAWLWIHVDIRVVLCGVYAMWIFLSCFNITYVNRQTLQCLGSETVLQWKKCNNNMGNIQYKNQIQINLNRELNMYTFACCNKEIIFGWPQLPEV